MQGRKMLLPEMRNSHSMTSLFRLENIQSYKMEQIFMMRYDNTKQKLNRETSCRVRLEWTKEDLSTINYHIKPTVLVSLIQGYLF